MKIGVVLPTSAEWSELRDVARQAEEVGVGSLWVPDGFVDGHLEASTVLSAVAAVTEGVELGAYMLNPSLRDPALLSKVVGTLDRLAPGRIRVLLGTGWDRADYAALGREFPSPAERAEATKEAVSVLKARTGVSIEVAGVRDEVLRLAAAEADGWSVSADALDAFFERIAFLRRACEDVGRSLADVRVSCTLPPDEAMSRAKDLAKHGMDELFVDLTEGPEGRDRLEQLVREMKPQLV